MTLDPGIKYGRHSRWRLTNMATNQVWRTLQKHPTYLISNQIIAQDNTYIHIRAKTPIKSNLLYKCWFTENSETVLKVVIYGKPKQFRPTTQSSEEWVNIKVNSKLITTKTKMMSRSNMAKTNMTEIPMWREFQHGWHSKKQRKF